MKAVKGDTMALIVDYQERLVPAMAEKEEIVKRAEILIRGLKALEIPMLITQQYTKGLGMSVDFVYEAAETKNYMEKMTFSCLGDEKIAKAVRNVGKKNVIVCGVEAHICVLQTCMDLKEHGFRPILVTDCIASRDNKDRDMAVNRAIQEGVTVTTSEAILFELLGKAEGDTFKVISRLVK